MDGRGWGKTIRRRGKAISRRRKKRRGWRAEGGGWRAEGEGEEHEREQEHPPDILTSSAQFKHSYLKVSKIGSPMVIGSPPESKAQLVPDSLQAVHGCPRGGACVFRLVDMETFADVSK